MVRPGSSPASRGRRRRPSRGGERLRVAVLMGGTSSEHDISVQGASNVVAALASNDRFDVLPVLLGRDGRWSLPKRAWRPRGAVAVGAPSHLPPPPFDPYRPELWRDPVGLTAGLDQLIERHVDVAFPVLHGRFGEDGTLQACLAAAGIPYVGSDMRGSALAFDKVRTKEVLAFHGIDTPAFEVVQSATARPALQEHVERWAEAFGLPFIIKDPFGGSSLEVRRVSDPGEALAAAYDLIGSGAQRLLVEALARGRELTLGVLELRGSATALPLVEIRARDGARFFDFHQKYAEDGAEEICPADVDAATRERLQTLGLEVHRRLGLRGLSRTDVILDDQGTAWVLEVNTLPGMTERGLVPLAAAEAGIGFTALLEGLVLGARVDD